MRYSCKKQGVAVGCALFIFCGCTHHLVTLPLVSMTKRESPDGSKLKKIGAVKNKYCTSETPIAPGPDNNPALIDEVVLRTQKANKADYLRDAVLTVSGGFFSSTCVSLQAEAVKS